MIATEETQKFPAKLFGCAKCLVGELEKVSTMFTLTPRSEPTIQPEKNNLARAPNWNRVIIRPLIGTAGWHHMKQDFSSNILDVKQDFVQIFWMRNKTLFNLFWCQSETFVQTFWRQS